MKNFYCKSNSNIYRLGNFDIAQLILQYEEKLECLLILNISTIILILNNYASLSLRVVSEVNKIRESVKFPSSSLSILESLLIIKIFSVI